MSIKKLFVKKPSLKGLPENVCSIRCQAITRQIKLWPVVWTCTGHSVSLAI